MREALVVQAAAEIQGDPTGVCQPKGRRVISVTLRWPQTGCSPEGNQAAVRVLRLLVARSKAVPCEHVALGGDAGELQQQHALHSHSCVRE
jgi:hypothetical protein